MGQLLIVLWPLVDELKRGFGFGFLTVGGQKVNGCMGCHTVCRTRDRYIYIYIYVCMYVYVCVCVAFLGVLWYIMD